MNPQIQENALKTIRSGVYQKNIHYFFGPQLDPEQYKVVNLLAGSSGASSWIIQKSYHHLGVQMQVSKQVSDDLIATDFGPASRVENVPWIAPVVEVYFEDPILPTILVMKTTPKKLQEWFPMLEVELFRDEYINALMQESGEKIEAKQLSLQLAPEMYDEFLLTAQTPPMKSGIFSVPLSESDNEVICFMLHLVLKTFAFASIPHFKPIPLTRKQMTMGGKAGVKERPNRPSLRITYLPKIITPFVTKDIIPSGGKEFRGRRGHIRWYNSERFTHRKGTWDMISPVKDPHTGEYPKRMILKVRKA